MRTDEFEPNRRVRQRDEGGVDPRFARSVGRWLVAYPPRWRRARADEVTVVLADLAAPAATRLDARSGLGLVVAGLRTRHRMAPPLHVRLGYLLLGLRVKPQHRPWVDDQIRGRLVGQSLGLGLTLAVIYTVPGLLINGRPTLAWPFMGWFGVYYLLVSATRARRQRLYLAAKHLVPQPGEDPVPGGYVLGWVYRERMAARSGARLAVAVIGWCALASGLARVADSWADGFAAGWPEGAPLAFPAVLFAQAAALGVVVGLVALLRWRRGLERLPEQPARLVAPVNRRQRVNAVLWGAFVAAGCGATVPSGQWWMNDIVLASALVALPWTVAAWWRTRRAVPEGLALVDLRNLTWGRTTNVEAPVDSAVIWQPGTTLAAATGTVAPAPTAEQAPGVVVVPSGPEGPAPA